MFKRKKEDKIEEPFKDERLSDSEIGLLKTLIDMHTLDIAKYKLDELTRQDPKVKYPYGVDKDGKSRIPYASAYSKSKKDKGSYNPIDY